MCSSPNEVRMRQSGARFWHDAGVYACAGLLAILAAECSPVFAGGRGPIQEGSTQPAQMASTATTGIYPRLYDITATTKIDFEHVSSPEQKYIVESMGGGV